jgi:hypothetical protein
MKWELVAEEYGPQILSLVRGRQTKRLAERLTRLTGREWSWDETSEFATWWRAEMKKADKTQKVQAKATPPPPPAGPKKSSSMYEHNQAYWYDEARDKYVVHLPSKKKPMAIPGDRWRAMREGYSNWDGAPESINEMARKFSMARRTVVELLRVMGTTHDSSPWSDEELLNADEDTLVEDLLRRKEEKVMVRADQKEWGRIKRDAESFRKLDFMAKRLGERFQEASPKYDVPRLSMSRAEAPWAAVISPTDFHWGGLFPEYTGAPWNREIARRVLFGVTSNLISRLERRGRPDKIILALGGDGLTIDNMQKTTTKGTPQDVDGSSDELAWTWVQLCRDYIDLLRQVCPVDVYCIPGNHDRYTTTLLRAALEGWFHKASDVYIHESYSSRQYAVYGENMANFMHGDLGKTKDWPAIIAGENPEEWGRCKHRYIFTGHLHTERELPTFGGTTVYRMPSLTGASSWEHNHGYKSRRALIAYVLDAEKGMVAQEVEPYEEEV